MFSDHVTESTVRDLVQSVDFERMSVILKLPELPSNTKSVTKALVILTLVVALFVSYTNLYNVTSVACFMLYRSIYFWFELFSNFSYIISRVVFIYTYSTVGSEEYKAHVSIYTFQQEPNERRLGIHYVPRKF